MCIIQIWTTFTCSSAYKLVEKSNLCPWVHAYVPCKKWEWISNTMASMIAGKTLRCLLLNSSKSKTRMKFMKLGMLSWSGINMPWYNFCPIWGRFGYMLLTNGSFSQQAWWFLVGTVSLLGTKWYPLPLIVSKFGSRVNIEQQECCVNFCDFWGSFGHFYALTEFLMHLCA